MQVPFWRTSITSFPESNGMNDLDDSGQVTVYQIYDSKLELMPYGEDIDGEEEYEDSGYSSGINLRCHLLINL
jgi:hypothetical protein